MARRPCLDCPALAEPGKARCRTCEARRQHTRNTTRPQYSGAWDRDAREQIDAYRATHGDMCPGWAGDPPHPIDPSEWTCDHDEGPMCRTHNGAKGGSHDRRRAQAQRDELAHLRQRHA